MIEQLAARINAIETFTPVLVTPQRVHVRADFLADLALCLIKQANRSLLFERIGLGGGFVCGIQNQYFQRRIDKRLRQLGGQQVDFLCQETAMPTRRSSTDRFVVGFCSQTVELPNWVACVPIGWRESI